MDIICRERSCVYNKGFSCTSKQILIGNKINCTDYKKNDDLKNIPDTSSEIFAEQPPKYHPHRETKRGCIHCKANCLFRTDDICDANGITVNCIKNMPLCATYFKK